MPVIALILFAMMVSFFAGIYPALVLSGTQIIGVLKKGFTFTGGNSMIAQNFDSTAVWNFCIPDHLYHYHFTADALYANKEPGI